jgi:hypothetical protein
MSPKTMKETKIKILMTITALMIAIGIAASTFPAIYTTLEHREYNIRYDHVQGHLNGIESVVVSGDTLFVLTNQSDCLIAFDLEGDPLYTIYFEPAESGINEMLLLDDGSLVIDASGVGLLKFKDGVLIDHITRGHPDYDKYMDMMVFERPELATFEAEDQYGAQYTVNLTSTGVDVTRPNSVVRTLVVEPLPYWLLSFPFPSLVYIFGGLFIWSRLKKQLQSLRPERQFVKPDDFA